MESGFKPVLLYQTALINQCRP